MERESSSSELLKATLGTAMPMLVTLSLSSLIGLSDMYMAGTIGDTAQAAVGIADQVLFLTVLTATGLCAGTGACVARATGAGDSKLAKAYGRESLAVCAMFGACAWLIGALCTEQIFALFGANAEVTALGVPYLRLCAFGNLPWSIAQCQTAILRATGAARLSIFQWLVTSIFSVGASALLFFSRGSIGYHSLNTLAVTWDAGCLVGVAIGFYYLRKNWGAMDTGLAPSTTSETEDNHQLQQRLSQLMRIGVPVMLAEVCWIGSNFLMYRLFSSMPDASAVQAAWSIKSKVEDALANTPLLALSLASATLVGQNLGAGRIEQARKIGWQLAMLGAASMLGLGGILFCTAPYLASHFSAIPHVTATTAFLLQGSPLVLPLTAIALVLFSGLEGAGVTKTAMIMNVIGLILIRFPLAWTLALPLGLGVMGIWIASTVSWIFMSAAASISFAKRGWEVTGTAI